MTAKEMMKRIDARLVADRRKEEDAMEQTRKDLQADAEAVMARLPELREIAPIVTKLIDNRLVPFHGLGMSNFSAFETNGVDHNLGFADRTRPHVWFGREAGGCDGSYSAYVNIHTGLWTIHAQWYDGRFRLANPLSAADFAEKYSGERFVRGTIHHMATGDIDRYLALVQDAVAKM